MSNTKQILIRALELIDTKGWTQGVLARNNQGKAVRVEDTTACSFCIIGATDKAAQDLGMNSSLQQALAKEALSSVLNVLNYHHVGCWNDQPERTKEEVIELFRKAIDMCSE